MGIRASGASERLQRELHSFQRIWRGGYFEGDPLVRLGTSSYEEMGYISVLHAIYLVCIRPYVNESTIALEIGPGRGGWTRALLPCREVWCMDALSAEHNEFWNFVGRHDHIRYLQVSDFECRDLPDDRFNYLFSFGCLCHVSFEGITAYLRNLYPKLKSGAHAFIMVADYDKHNQALLYQEKFSVARSLLTHRKIYLPLYWQWRTIKFAFELAKHLVYGSPFRNKLEDDEPAPARWYHAGLDRTCSLLVESGYEIVESDVGILPGDPIIHFVKP